MPDKRDQTKMETPYMKMVRNEMKAKLRYGVSYVKHRQKDSLKTTFEGRKPLNMQG